MSQIKINRARKLSKIGATHGSFAAMLATVPAGVIAALSSAQLASLIDANWSLAQASKRIAERDACAEGAIWDGQRSNLREIA